MKKQEVINNLTERISELSDGMLESAKSDNSWEELRKVATDTCTELLRLKHQIEED